MAQGCNCIERDKLRMHNFLGDFWSRVSQILGCTICGADHMARLTKAYYVTIQRYHTSHTKKCKTGKHIFCGVWVPNFVWNFNGALWNFTQIFEPTHRKICILWGVQHLTTYDILDLWHLKSKWDGPNVAANDVWSHCNSTGTYPIFKWVAVTWLNGRIPVR